MKLVYFFGIKLRGGLVRHQHHYNVCPLGGFSNGGHFKARLLGLGAGFGAGSKADLYMDS